MKFGENAPLKFVDVAADQHAGEPHGVSCSLAMKRMHVADADGRVFNSVDAFVQIWRRLPQRRFHLLAWIFSRQPMRWIGNTLYGPFADNRMAISGFAAKLFGIK